MSERILKMFDNISGRYDFMNSLLSFGLHHFWRQKTLKLSDTKEGMSVLDCATGTGDFAIQFKKAVGIDGNVIGVDLSDNMMNIARNKINRKKLGIIFQKADVLNLPFSSNEFDICSIAFGIRNVDSISKCLIEMARVVKRGGKVIILELGQPLFPISLIYKFYSKFIIPLLGLLFAGNRKAYLYLPKSAEIFPCRENFIEIMEQTGKFKDCYYKSLSFGITYVYIGSIL